MDSIQQEQILYRYCANKMQKLKQICYPKICKIGGISQMDHDDLYSIALDVLRYSVERYDDSQGCKFSTYLNGNIDRKFSTYVRDKLREKRSGVAQYDEDGNRVFNQNISLDENAEDGTDLKDKIASDFNTEDQVFRKIDNQLDRGCRFTASISHKPIQTVLNADELCLSSDEIEEWHDEVKTYLKSLSPLQRKIIFMLADNKEQNEICGELHITVSHYNNSLKRLMSSEKIDPLRPLVEKENRRPCNY